MGNCYYYIPKTVKVNRFFPKSGIFFSDFVNMNISGREVVKRMNSRKELKAYINDLHIPAQTISNWKTRDKAPKSEELYQIAQYLGVSMEWLLTGEEPSSTALPQGIEKFPLLNAEHQRMITTMIEALYTQEEQDLTALSAARTG